MKGKNSFIGVGVVLLVGMGGCARPTAPGGAGPAGPRLGRETARRIQIKGSDTMVNLCQAWAEAFMAKTGTPVAVTGGGSGVGIASLLNGTCDIAAASREMEGRELEQARRKNIQPRKFIVGLDGLAVVVNPKNPVSRLTLDQIADIFRGKITRWDQVGGRREKIVLLSREVNSGTHVYFKEHVLRRGRKDATDEFSPEALLLPSSQDIAEQIAHNEQAIGYYGMGYLNATQKAIAVAKGPGQPYVEPRMEAVLDGSYPISRPLLMYTNGEPTGAVKEFLDFALSEEGQQIVKEQDFVPAPPQANNP